MIASLQRQIASLEGVINTLRRELGESRGEPAPASSARTDAAAAAQAAPAATTTTKRKAASTTPHAAATNGTTAATPPKTSTSWQLAGSSHSRRSRGAQEAPGAAPPTPPKCPCVCTGTGSGYRSLEHRDGCLCRSGHLPAHPYASSQPYRAQEDIKTARSNITLWGIGGVAEGSAPPPPQQAGPGRSTYASATRSAARGSRPGAVRVVAAAARTSAALPPVQPTAAALWALLPSTTAMQPLRLF